MRRGHTHNFPHVSPLSWSPGISPARNPLSPKENTAAFVIKNHRHMGFYFSKANFKETVDPRFLCYDYKMPQHPNEEMDKKHVRPPPASPPDGFTGSLLTDSVRKQR